MVYGTLVHCGGLFSWHLSVLVIHGHYRGAVLQLRELPELPELPESSEASEALMSHADLSLLFCSMLESQPLVRIPLMCAIIKAIACSTDRHDQLLMAVLQYLTLTSC